MVSPLVSLMVDQVYSLQAHGVCAAILNSGAVGAIVGIADGNRSFLSYEIVAVTVLCIQMCLHTLSAHSLRERLHHCQIFYCVLYGK